MIMYVRLCACCVFLCGLAVFSLLNHDYGYVNFYKISPFWCHNIQYCNGFFFLPIRAVFRKTIADVVKKMVCYQWLLKQIGFCHLKSSWQMLK